MRYLFECVILGIIFGCVASIGESTIRPDGLKPILNAELDDSNDLMLVFDKSKLLTKKIKISELDTRWSGGGGGGGAWGEITGTLSNQTDLQSALNAKQATGSYMTALTGEVTAAGPGSSAATLTNSAVIGKVLTGFSSGAGTVASTDTILQGFNKVVGNMTLLAPLDSPTFTGTITGTLSGNASTATALASNPSDCSSGQYATAIAANGNLSCGTIPVADVTGAAPAASPAFTTQVTFGNYHLEPSEVDDGNSSTADTIDWSTGSAHKSTLTGNVTYTFSNPVTGGAYVLKILTGAGSFSTTWPGNVKWPGGITPTITSTAARLDLVNLYYDGTNYYGSYTQNYTP